MLGRARHGSLAVPLRGEYDTEWSNEAELTICDIEFPDNETEDEKEAKLAALRE